MKRLLKKVHVIFILAILLLALIYVSNITCLPDRVILLEGEKLNLKTFFGINIESQASSNPEFITASADTNNTGNSYKVNYEISLFGVRLKEINAYVIEKTEVVPLRGFNRFKTLYKWRFSCGNVRDNRY